jgi:raffinose/stachyose/melibiose transport system permease protein
MNRNNVVIPIKTISLKKSYIKSLISTYLVVLFFLTLWLAPIYTAIVKSFDINGISNYLYVLTHPKVNYFRVVYNSVFMASCSALIIVLITTLASFAFSKMNFKLSKLLYYMILACLAIPIASVTSPLFFTINRLKMLDTYSGVILPLVAFNAPFMLMLVKNYFDGIPDELLEAARIDGISVFQVYRHIMLPLSIPIIATVAVLTFVYSWNDYLIPLLMIRSETKYTVTLAARYFMETTHQSPADVARVYSALIMMTIPSVAIYLFSQRYLQAGITAGAIKS